MSDYADIINVRVQNGEVRLTLGDALTGAGVAQDATIWGSGRFISVPMAPDANGAAQAVYEANGQSVRVFGWFDNRIAAKSGSLGLGDLAIVGYGAARWLMKHDDDSVTAYTETADGDSVVITASGGDERIFAAIGSSYIEMKKDEGTISMGGVTIHCKDGNCTIFATHFHAASSTGQLGLVGPIGPIAPAMGIVFGPAGVTAIGSSKWAVAP